MLSGSVQVDAPGRTLILRAGAEFAAIGSRITGSRTATVTVVEDTCLAVLTTGGAVADPSGTDAPATDSG